MSGIRALKTGVLLAPLLVASHAAWAQTTPPAKSGASIFSCTDANGKRLTSDRPIPECVAREQRVLNADGSVKRVVPPTLTADERAEAEARERRSRGRARGQAGHDPARPQPDAALPQRSGAPAGARRRARDRAQARCGSPRRASRCSPPSASRCQEETEFYAGKQLPAKLKSQLDANDAALTAQRSLMQDQEAEVGRIDSLFDAELARLKKLWAGRAARLARYAHGTGRGVDRRGGALNEAGQPLSHAGSPRGPLSRHAVLRARRPGLR